MILGCVAAQARPVVVADSASRVPLPNASVYDRNGRAIATTGRRGVLPPVAERSYPLTIRYLGFEDKILESAPTDTVFLREFAEELPEVVIETRNRRVFHILAYVREYSTMTTLSDTIFLFREKMVDRDERIRHYRETVNKAAAAVVFRPLIHGVAHIIPAIDPTHQRA